ncbi:MAG: ATP-binding protein [Anaerolineales bacterium]
MGFFLSALNRFLSPNLPKESPTRHRARLIMAVSGLTLLIYFIPEVITHLLVPFDPLSLIEISIILFSTIMTLAGFLVAKLGFVEPAAWLTLLGWMFDILLDVAFGEGMDLGASLEIWLMIGLVIAFLLLDLRRYIVLAVLQTLLIWLALWLRYRSGIDFSINVEIHLAAVALLGLASWLRDSDHRQREEAATALQKQKEYLQRVIDGVQSPLYVVDVKDYRIRLANSAARKLGLVEDQVTCYALTHHRSEPCSGDEHPCPLKHVSTERKPYTTEHIHFLPDGSTYYAEVRGYPLFDENGEVIQMIEHSLDVTERKLQEAEIRKLQQAIEHAASGVVITDAEGFFEYVNPTFERMTGYRCEEVLGKTPRLLKSGKHSTEFYNELWRTIKSGRVWEGELINRRKDGSLYWEFQTIAPVVFNGRISHFVGIKLDITNQKLQEEELRKAKEAAEIASAFKDQLLSRVSHELRTPLSSILGYAELLQHKKFGDLSEKQHQVIEHILESTHYLSKMIEDLLDEAAISARSIQLQNEPFTLDELIRQVSATLLVQAQNRGLTFTIERSPGVPNKLYGDMRRLQQIILNLAGNAIKFTQHGEVSVRFVRPDSDNWAIVVSDTGIGIPNEAKEYIFEPFRRLDNRLTYESRGSGLGLSIVKQLVEMMGGGITVESEVGKGSTFTVTLPLVNARQASETTIERNLIEVS